MKRVKIVILILGILLTTLSAGCAGEPDVSATISGGFVAKVHLLLPNYSVDETTLSEAVVTEFQTGPFIVTVGPEMASQLQLGQRYFFEIQSKDIGEISQSEFDRGCQDVEAAIATHDLRISGVRMASEDEKGMRSSKMIYEKTKQK